jgi:hypothetical protein
MTWLRPILKSARLVLTVVALIALAAKLSDVHYTGAGNLHDVDSLGAASVAQLVLGSSLGAAQISARALNPRRARTSSSGHAGSSRRRRAKQSNRDQVLEIPPAIDSRSPDQVGGESTFHDADNDPQLGAADVANDAPQFLSGIVRPVGTLQDYENGAKNRPVPTVCIGPKWWWTSGVPVCTPIVPSPNTAQPHDSP